MQDVWSHPADQLEIRNLKTRIEHYLDFIGYLFDKHIDYQSETETWEEFEKYENEQYENEQYENERRNITKI